MIHLRKSAERGHFNYGWLDTYHSFAFNTYYDINHMGFRSLRVINEDRISPRGEFGTHPHRDMEIITYIISGELHHQDSMGNGSSIGRGEVQRMTAGSGILHSEANNSGTKPTHMFQIWIIPNQRGLIPEYEQNLYDNAEKLNRFCLIASPDGHDNSVKIHQEVLIHASILDAGKSLTYNLPSGRHTWIQVASGSVSFNGQTLNAGDGASTSDEAKLSIIASEKTEFLLFDLA